MAGEGWSSSSSRLSFRVQRVVGGSLGPGAGACLFQIRSGTARCGVGLVPPVVLAASEIELQVLPVGVGEALALDFAQQRLEVAQAAHGLRGGPVEQRQRLAHAAEQDGVEDRCQGHVTRSMRRLEKIPLA